MALADLLWTEDDMEHFLRIAASFERHKAHWKQKHRDRQDENHRYFWEAHATNDPFESRAFVPNHIVTVAQ
eukprot:7906716-Lingulodinium_polyedra.AAC.1